MAATNLLTIFRCTNSVTMMIILFFFVGFDGIASKHFMIHHIFWGNFLNPTFTRSCMSSAAITLLYFMHDLQYYFLSYFFYLFNCCFSRFFLLIHFHSLRFSITSFNHVNNAMSCIFPILFISSIFQLNTDDINIEMI